MGPSDVPYIAPGDQNTGVPPQPFTGTPGFQVATTPQTPEEQKGRENALPQP